MTCAVAGLALILVLTLFGYWRLTIRVESLVGQMEFDRADLSHLRKGLERSTVLQSGRAAVAEALRLAADSISSESVKERQECPNRSCPSTTPTPRLRPN